MPASEAAGPGDPTFFVPPVCSRSTRWFGLTWLLSPVLLAAGLPFFTFGFVNRYDNGEAAFVEGLYQRKAVAMARAAERADESGKPRLVVVGGSGALLGIDAELIERKLGVPCVNLATHAGLGGEYILDRARRELRPGDAVLLCPEYQLWGGPADGAFTDQEWAYACTYDKQFLLGLERRRLVKMLYSVPLADYGKSVRGCVSRARGKHHHTRAGYNLATVSLNGDLRAALPRVRVGHNPGYPFPDVRSAAAAPSFRAFASWTRSNNVRVFFTWPNMVRPDVALPPGADAPPAEMKSLLDDLGFTVLDAPSENVYPRPWFTDTAYHTDGCCRRIRTEQLVRRLRPHFGLAPVPETATGVYLVTGGTHRPTNANAFADDPGVRAKYLVAEPVDHHDAVTPAGVIALVETGLAVYFDDDEVARRLSPVGLPTDEVSHTTASLPRWLREYDRHVLLIARAGKVTSATSPSLPSALSQALRRPLPVAAAVGTGPFRHVETVRSGPSAGRNLLKTDLRALVGRDVPQLALAIAPPAVASGARAEIRVNRQDWVRAREDDPAGAISVVVIDPAMGVVVDAATFPDGGDGEVAVRSLRRLRLRR